MRFVFVHLVETKGEDEEEKGVESTDTFTEPAL